MYAKPFINSKATFMKLIYYVFKILGLMPMNLKMNIAKNKIAGFERSKKSLVYNACLTGFLLIINYYSIFFKLQLNFWQKVPFERAFDLVQTSSNIIVTVVILLHFTVYHSRLIKIANELVNLIDKIAIIDDKLSNGKRTAFKSIRNIFLINTLSWIFILVTTSAANIYVFLYHLVKYPCVLIISYAFLQYSTILKLVKIMFAKLNTSFVNVTRKTITTEIAVVEQNEESKKNFDNNMQASEKINMFHTLCDSYISLCEVSHDLSDFYSLPMLLGIAHVFLTLILSAYYIVTPVVLGKNRMPLFTGYFHCAAFTTHNFILLVTITKCVNAIIIEVRKRMYGYIEFPDNDSIFLNLKTMCN